MAGTLGSTRVMTDSTGNVCFDAEYYPYGRERDFTNNCPQNFKFTGKERDPETGLDNFGARYYASSYARFMSPDPGHAGASLANPESWDAYTYTLDNPETLTDPTGTAPSDGEEATYWRLYWKDHFGLGPGSGTSAAATKYAPAHQQKNGVVQKLKAWAKAHPKTTKVVVTTVIVGTALSGLLDDGASEAALPAEESAGAALEGGAEAETGAAEAGTGSTSVSPPADPTQAPGSDWEWRGRGAPGSPQGSWYNPSTGESLHPDLLHGEPIGPHWDYTNPSGANSAFFPMGE